MRTFPQFACAGRETRFTFILASRDCPATNTPRWSTRDADRKAASPCAVPRSLQLGRVRGLVGAEWLLNEPFAQDFRVGVVSPERVLA